MSSREKALLGMLIILLLGAGYYLIRNRPQAAQLLQTDTYSCSGKPTVGSFYPTSDGLMAPTKPTGNLSGTSITWSWSPPPIDELAVTHWSETWQSMLGIERAHAGVSDNATYCLVDYQVDVSTSPGGSDIASQSLANGSLSLTSFSLSAGTYYSRIRAVWYGGLSGVTWTTDWSANSDPVTIAAATPTPTETTSSSSPTAATTSPSPSASATTSPTSAASASPNPTTSAATTSPSATTTTPSASPTTAKTTTAAASVTPTAGDGETSPPSTEIAAVAETGAESAADVTAAAEEAVVAAPQTAVRGGTWRASSLFWLSFLAILLLALLIVWWFLARRRRFEEDEVRRNPNLWKRRVDS